MTWLGGCCMYLASSISWHLYCRLYIVFSLGTLMLSYIVWSLSDPWYLCGNLYDLVTGIVCVYKSSPTWAQSFHPPFIRVLKLSNLHKRSHSSYIYNSLEYFQASVSKFYQIIPSPNHLWSPKNHMARLSHSPDLAPGTNFAVVVTFVISVGGKNPLA